MKVLILAGGYGSRLAEETELKPKPMVEIGGKPILWHIMKIYSSFGLNEFIILCGYKGYLIKEYFANYHLHHADVTYDLRNNSATVHTNHAEPWKVTLLDTGLDTMTGGRVKKAERYVDGQPFMLTYGDGVANVDIEKLLEFHKSHNGIMTITSSQPEGRFGALDINDNGMVSSFVEKPKGDGAWINAGYFVCNPEIFTYLNGGDDLVLEGRPLQKLASDKQLYTYKHPGFWHPMDTLRDRIKLSQLWNEGKAPWKTWTE
jgi:glucose-1-phosphate cytidylyltransferase